ncbi:hypothetical protein LSH36_788g01011 [Paralvinella palmiformis]|uniref:Uncharacterized protein n=1 Tax=Paralvinella palmiformis TaxID=53620 RepID=A0AAD9J017_9ANNE|nr:hypothetical protein LSH36_788g01011 [Paralvinella palmiformis]
MIRVRFYCDPDNVRPGHNCIRIDFYLAVHATCVDCYDPAGCGEKFLFVRLVEFLCAYEESPSSKPSSSCVNEVNTLSRLVINLIITIVLMLVLAIIMLVRTLSPLLRLIFILISAISMIYRASAEPCKASADPCATLALTRDILAYRMSNGTQGAEITSKYMWRQLLNTPEISELDVLSKPIWQLEILLNRNSRNLLPLVSRRLAKRGRQVKENLFIILRPYQKVNSWNDVVIVVVVIVVDVVVIVVVVIVVIFLVIADVAAIEYNYHDDMIVVNIDEYDVVVIVVVVDDDDADDDDGGGGDDDDFHQITHFNETLLTSSKCRLHNESAERMRYRVTYGDIKSNVLDIASQLFWIKGDTKRAKKILKQITPRFKTLKDQVDQLWSLTYHDLMTDKIKAFLQSARNNFLELHGLSSQLNTRIPDLAVKCSYLDVIISPTRYEKARVDVAFGKVLKGAAFAIKGPLSEVFNARIERTKLDRSSLNTQHGYRLHTVNPDIRIKRGFASDELKMAARVWVISGAFRKLLPDCHPFGHTPRPSLWN